jgi:hypothetical protein
MSMPHDDLLSDHTEQASSVVAGACEGTLAPWEMTDLHDAMVA